jgi:hypothetical protein
MILPNMTSVGAGMQRLENGAQNAQMSVKPKHRAKLEMHFNRFLLLQLFLKPVPDGPHPVKPGANA